MNHYERLKVSRDAPPEVIRAAYRALANKLHPDRVGGGQGGPDDEQHAQMAALNAAYETLMNAKARQSYDDALALSDTHSTFGGHSTHGNGHSAFRPTGWGAGAAHEGPASTFAGQDGNQGPNTRIDLDWLNPRAPMVQSLWPPSRRTLVFGGGVGGLVLMAVVLWGWQMWGQHQTERALSRQYSQSPVADPVTLPPPAAQPRAPANTPPVAVADARRPTVEELSRMSDEELLQVLPALDGTPAKGPATATPNLPTLAADPVPNATLAAAPPPATKPARAHPLDGAPINLRTDSELIDPLAQ